MLIKPIKLKKVNTLATTATPTLAEVKAHLRVDHSDDDSLINSLIYAAQEAIEHETGRALAYQTYEAAFTFWPRNFERLELPRSPFVSLSNVSYYDHENAAQTVATSNFIVTDYGPTHILAVRNEKQFSLPTLTKDTEARVFIQFVAGPPAFAPLPEQLVPETLKHALKLLVAHFYDTREPVAYNAQPMKVPRSIDYLLGQHKKVRV